MWRVLKSPPHRSANRLPTALPTEIERGSPGSQHGGMLATMSDQHPLYESLLASFAANQGGRPPRPSAAIVPWRRDASGALEVYWVRRSPQLRFMGGWHAFPGGGLSRRDAGLEIAGQPAGGSETSASRAQGPTTGVPELPPDVVPGLLACALRELFEETGLLTTPALMSEDAPSDTVGRLAALRRDLLEGDASFAEVLAAAPTTAEPLVFAGRWLTPPVAPMRFDNRFFLLEWPSERTVQPSIIPGELAEGEWIAPARALDRWRDGEVMLAPPIVHLLRVLDEDGPESGLDRLREPEETFLGPFRRVEFRPDIVLLPLLTPTLPPATHTNAFLIGRDRAILVDPASPIPGEQDRLEAAVDAFLAEGSKVEAIWLTHHHQDHIGGVERMRRHLGVPVLAHPLSAKPLERIGISLDGTLDDGHEHELGGDGGAFRVCHTPGHTRGHLAFFHEATASLIAGDLVSTLSTIVIDPPEGDMGAYLDSLSAMAKLSPSTLFPSHGPAILDAVAKLEEYHHHRLEREAQILDAHRRGQTTPESMVAEIYADVPPMVHPIACRQIEAHLARLRGLGEL